MKKNCEGITAVKIFYIGICLLTLTERNTKRFQQHWHLPKLPSTEWSCFFFYIEFVIFSLFAIAYMVCSWIIAIFKECKYDKRRHPTVYMFISCILMSQNCIRSGKSCKMYAISIQCFQVQMFLFYISKLNNAICWECLAYTIDMLYYLFLQYLT